MPSPRLVIGCMTGTSLDAVDAAALRIDGDALDIRATFLAARSGGLNEAAALLRPLARAESLTAEQVARAMRALGEAIADTVEALAADLDAPPTLIALHGQTVFHRAPWSWQLIDPWVTARRLACPVVFDLRGADLAAGGQGAPITPLADWILFRDTAPAGRDRAIVNLGGFCNATLLPGAPSGTSLADVRGFDVCACNQILDLAARRGLHRPFDDKGAAALSGTPRTQAVEALVAILTDQSLEGRSLGTGDEAIGWCEQWSERLIGVDLVASAARAVGTVIARTLAPSLAPHAQLFLAGGGVRNRALLHAIESERGRPTATTDELGIPAQFREAACMGVLGALASDAVRITLPGVTGAREPIPLSGAWVNVRPNLPT